MSSRLPILSENFTRAAPTASVNEQARHAASALIRDNMIRRMARSSVMFAIVVLLGFGAGEGLALLVNGMPTELPSITHG